MCEATCIIIAEVHKSRAAESGMTHMFKITVSILISMYLHPPPLLQYAVRCHVTVHPIMFS
jgi:hypothetical protein